MVQRHRAIEDVARLEHRLRDGARRAPLGHPHGFGRACGPGREQQREQRLGIGRVERIQRTSRDCFGRARDGSSPRGRVDVEDPVTGEIERDALQQGPHDTVGDDELAVGVVDVARELSAAARRIDTDDRRAREPGARQQEDELGHVLEEHADVERSGPPQLHEQLSPHACFLDDLAPGPSSILVAEPVGVVLRPAEDQLCEGRGCAVHYPSHVSGIECMPRTRLDGTHCGSPATT